MGHVVAVARASAKAGKISDEISGEISGEISEARSVLVAGDGSYIEDRAGQGKEVDGDDERDEGVACGVPSLCSSCQREQGSTDAWIRAPCTLNRAHMYPHMT